MGDLRLLDTTSENGVYVSGADNPEANGFYQREPRRFYQGKWLPISFTKVNTEHYYSISWNQMWDQYELSCDRNELYRAKLDENPMKTTGNGNNWTTKAGQSTSVIMEPN